MKLIEVLSPINKHTGPPAEAPIQKQMKQWFVDHRMDPDPVMVRADRKVDYFLTVRMTERLGSLKSIPVPFGYVSQSFYVDKNNIETLLNTPDHVGEDLILSFNPKLTSLEGLNCEIGDSVSLASTGLRSLHNVHKHIRHAKRLNVSNCKITSHILGVLLIKGIERFEYNWEFSTQGSGGWDYNSATPVKFIQKQLAKPANERDILECQEEMIDAGFGAYAKL